MANSDKLEDGRRPTPDSAAGDDLAKTLSERYRGPLIAFFRRRTAVAGEPEDLAQEVLLRVVRRNVRAPIEEPDAFIFQTARNLMLDRTRYAKVRQENYSEIRLRQETVEKLNPERVVGGRQELALVLSQLSALGEQTRDMLVLNRLECMTYQEIGDLYGISASAVRKRLFRAMELLLEMVEDE